MPFVLREENSTENPPLATVYGNQITAGKIVYFFKEGGRTRCIIFLGDGPMDGIEKLYYNGELVPEFTDTTQAVRNWKFHPGTKTTTPVFKDVTALTTDTLTLVAGHGFNTTTEKEVALVAGVDPTPSPYPTGVFQNRKLYVVYQSGNDIKLSLTDGGSPITGWPTTGTNNSYLLSNLKVYRANAGHFDPVQGRPEFFNTSTGETDPLDFTFSEIAYVEVMLSTTQSQIEDDVPTKFKIYVRGRKLQNYDEDGLFADSDGIAYPDQNNLPEETRFFSSNNALVALDIILNFMKILPERIDWASFVRFRNYCQETIQWNSGSDSLLANPNFGGLVATSFAGLINITENPIGTFNKTVFLSAWDAGALGVETLPDSAPRIEISETFVNGDHAFGLTKDVVTSLNPDTALYTIRTTPGYNINGAPNSGINSVYYVYRYGVPLFVSGEVEFINEGGYYHFNGDYAHNGDQFKITVDATTIRFFKNNVEFFSGAKDMNVADTDPVRATFLLYKSSAKVKDLKYYFSAGLINVTENPIGTFVKTSGTDGVYDATGISNEAVAYNADKIELSVIWRGDTIQVGLSQLLTTDTDVNKKDPTKATYTVGVNGTNGRIFVNRLGVPLYTGTLDNAITLGDKLRIVIDANENEINFYKNDLVFYTGAPSLSGTNPVRAAFFLYNSLSKVSDLKFFPMGGESRAVQRFNAHVVYPSEIQSSIALEQVMGRAPGCHWQDVHGKISFIVGSHYKNVLIDEEVNPGDRTLSKLLSYDPSQSVVKSNIVDNSFASYKKPVDQKQNFLRTEFRDFDDEFYTKKYSFGDRPSIRDYVGILIDFGIVQIGVATQSLADRISEAILRWNSDLDLFVTVRGTADTFTIAKGDIVKFAHDVPGWTLIEAPTFIVIEETFEPDTADERSFTLQVYNPEYYSDINHGQISTLLPAGDPPILEAPNSISYEYDGVRLKFYWDKSETTDISRYRLTDEYDRVIIETVNFYHTETNPNSTMLTRRVRTINTRDEVSSDYATVTFVKPPRLEWIEPVNVTINGGANDDQEKTLTTTTTAPGIKYATLKTAAIAGEIDIKLFVKPNVNNISQGACLSPNRFSFGTNYLGMYFNADTTFGNFPGDDSFGTFTGGEEFSIEISSVDQHVRKYRIYPSGEKIQLTDLGAVAIAPIYYARAFSNATVITTIDLSPVFHGNLTDTLESIPGVAQNVVNATYNSTLGQASRTSGAGWGTSGLSIPGVAASKNGGFYVLAFGSSSNDGSGVAVGLTNNDTNQNITSMPFWFTINPAGGIEYYTGNTLLFTDNNPSQGGLFPMFGAENIFIGRRGTEVFVSVDDYVSYAYTHASLDTEALSLDIAFNGSLGVAWTVSNIKVIEPYTTLVTPDNTPPTLMVGLRDNAKVGENLVYNIPKFATASPTLNQILQYNADIELVNVDPTEMIQDAVGSIFVDSSTVDFTYNDGTPSITASVIEAGLTLSNLGGTLSIAKGGSGQTTANTALNAFLPSQGSNANKALFTDGTNTSWINPLTIGRGVLSGGINRILYEDSSQNLAASAKFTFDGTDTFFTNSTASTVGSPSQPSGYIQFLGTAWKTSTSVSQETKLKIGVIPQTWPDGAGTFPKLSMQAWSIFSNDWQEFFAVYPVSVDNLTTRFKMRNPLANGWGGNIDVSYDGGFTFTDQSGAYSGMMARSFGSNPNYYAGFWADPSNPYRPEITAHFGDRIVLRQGSPLWYAGGASPGDSASGFVDIRMAAFVHGQGDIGGPTAKFQVRATTEQLRLEYDASNYFKVTVGSTGIASFDAVGSASAFEYLDNIIRTNNLAANTSGDGIVLINNGVASSGNQMYSPRLRLTGAGWKTQATAASQIVDWAIQTLPVQGVVAPLSKLSFQRQMNGGGFSEVIHFDNTGGISTSGNITASTFNNTLSITPAAQGAILTAGLSSPKAFAWTSAMTLDALADSQTFTFPASSTTIGGLGTTQTWTGLNTWTGKITVTLTTEQARIGYDASNYYKTTVSSVGLVTFDAVGSGARFVFSDVVSISNASIGDLTTFGGGVYTAFLHSSLGTPDTQYALLQASNGQTMLNTASGQTLDFRIANVNFASMDATGFSMRRKFRVYTTATTATLTPEISTYDIFHITAQNAALNIANHSTSTPNDGDKMEIRILDNGTARAITYGSAYVAKAGIALPSTTVVSKNMALAFEWNANLSKWNLMAVAQEV